MKEKIKELEDLIIKQQNLIQLLIERLSELADDIDKKEDTQGSYFSSVFRRTENWKW